VNFSAASIAGQPAVIGQHAFEGCIALETVTLTATKTIRGSAFSGCTALETVNLPASLTSISGNPFIGCTGLTEINVDFGNPTYQGQGGMLLDNTWAPETTLIGYPTASGTVDLSNITEVGSSAFEGCTALEAVNLTAVTWVGGYAFDGCTALETANIPAAESINEYAFNGCTALKTVTLTAAQTIYASAFYGCKALETVDLTAVVRFNSWYIFGATGTKALTVTLGDTPPTLGARMFYNVPYGEETGTKTVTVKVPDNQAWSDIISAYSDADTATENWGNAFRGMGWDGESYLGYTVNSNINLIIEKKTL
jgi:hypothetical protein